MRKTPATTRIWQRVHKTESCWLWTGRKDKRGYGYITSGIKRGHSFLTHRVAYESAYGSFDKSLYVCHKCDNPSCVRPDHLFLGTQTDNMRDCSAKGRNTKCYRWTSENNPFKGVAMSQEKRASVSQWKQRPFRVISPNGDIINAINLTQFCKQHGLNQGAMWSVINGRVRSHKGYTRATTE